MWVNVKKKVFCCSLAIDCLNKKLERFSLESISRLVFYFGVRLITYFMDALKMFLEANALPYLAAVCQARA